MKRVLITGISGVGKSVLAEELAARGCTAVDVDTPAWSGWVEVPHDEGVRPGRDWMWREDRIRELLDTEDADLLFVSGCAENQVKFRHRFDHVVLLTAPASLIAERLVTRTTNSYGKDPDELTRVLGLKETIEPLLRAGADQVIDTSVPLGEVVAAVLEHVRSR